MHKLLSAAVLVVAGGCTDGGPGDSRDDSFGGKGAKDDGAFSSCQLAEVLKLANESTSTVDKLADAGLADNAARAIVAHRNGADGDSGTADDDVFDDLDELDGVDFVGALALGKLVEAILPRCEVDLATRPFIDARTFAGSPPGGWARDNQEVESVLGVQGITGQRLRALLMTVDGNGRTLYDRLRRSRRMEAFTYGFSLDEIPWDSDSQAARELMPHVALTIEPDRFAIDVEDGGRELSLGTDLMDDSYYDTPGYTLLGNAVELRGRARWDNATTVRRLLIAAKFGTEIDAAGNKTNAKVDIRTDSGMTHLATLDNDVRRGKTNWNGTDSPAIPIKGVYEQLAVKNSLVDIGAHADVLLLDPKAHLRSTRSRYHMNEARIENIRAIYANATTRINAALNAIDRAQAAGTIPAANRAAVDALEVMGRRILDKTLLAERINAAAPGLGVTAANLVLPDAQPQPTTPAALDKNRVIAETINTVFHEFAAALDDADRILTNAVDEDFDDYAEMFRAWRVGLDRTLAVKTTYDSFLNSYRSLSTAANRAGSIAGFNTYGAAQRAANNDDFEDFEPLDDAAWTRLGGYLEKMTLTIGERQIETAGIAARQLWFDQARQLWVPNSSRAWSNFMIDTTDMTDMLSPEEWNSIPATERSFAQPLPATKVFHTVLVNELQIELGMEEDYVTRLRELTAAVAAAPTDATLAAQLAGAKFVWEQYTASMRVLTELKGEAILERLRRAGAPAGIRWAAPPDSKGNTALKILADRD
ncbi:MAG: hypothetical protein H0T89_23845 [Deltaproteobacteria bacterium]|nr:hypothetical protein [Deltaproteobacteria bacterium]